MQILVRTLHRVSAPLVHHPWPLQLRPFPTHCSHPCFFFQALGLISTPEILLLYFLPVLLQPCSREGLLSLHVSCSDGVSRCTLIFDSECVRGFSQHDWIWLFIHPQLVGIVKDKCRHACDLLPPIFVSSLFVSRLCSSWPVCSQASEALLGPIAQLGVVPGRWRASQGNWHHRRGCTYNLPRTTSSPLNLSF